MYRRQLSGGQKKTEYTEAVGSPHLDTSWGIASAKGQSILRQNDVYNGFRHSHSLGTPSSTVIDVGEGWDKTGRQEKCHFLVGQRSSVESLKVSFLPGKSLKQGENKAGAFPLLPVQVLLGSCSGAPLR